jgi:CheY-like chemotaxis protein
MTESVGSSALVPVSPRELAERTSSLMQIGLRELPTLLGKPIRLLIVDEVPEARRSIPMALQFETDIVVVGEAGTGLEGLWRYKQLRPDVVCTGIDMPEMGGLTMTSRLCQRNPEAKVLVLSVRTDPWHMECALRAGALDYLTKPLAPDAFPAAVREVHRTTLSRQARVLPSSLDGGGCLYYLRGGIQPDAELVRVVLGEEIPRDATVLGITFRDASCEADEPPQCLSLADLRWKLSLPAIGLDFSLSEVTDDDLAGMTPLVWVESLNLLGTQVGTRGAGFLDYLQHVRNLNLRGTPLDDCALRILRQLSTLEELDLSSTGLTDEGLGRCLPLPVLRRLHLEDNRLHGKELVRLLPHMIGLRDLSLAGNVIGPSTIRELARVILRERRRDLRVKMTGPPLDKKTRRLVERTNSPGSVGILYRIAEPPFS